MALVNVIPKMHLSLRVTLLQIYIVFGRRQASGVSQSPRGSRMGNFGHNYATSRVFVYCKSLDA